MPMYNLLVYSSSYSDTIGSLWFYSKDEATNFKLDLVDCTASIFQSVELLGNTEADGANGILKKTTIAVPVKCLSNLWRSIQFPLISWKVESKLKGTIYCILSVACADNNAVKFNNIIVTIK